MKRWNSRTGMSIVAAVAMLLISMVFTGMAPGASAEPSSSSSSNIEIIQTPSGATGPCLPPALGLRHRIVNTPETFTLVITVIAPLCTPVNPVAAIYAMPSRNVAWPQTLVETQRFTLREPGVTEVIFTKTCDPVQFDVINGPTPPVIAPWGPWHGPLLFPFDLNTSLQHRGCPTPPTTTVPDPCDDYTPRELVVDPTAAPAGTTLAVSGSGRPGTAVEVLLRPPGGGTAARSEVVVESDGSWATSVVIPSDAEPGSGWIVIARAVDCQDEVAAGIEVTSVEGSSTVPPAQQPEVGGADLEATPVVAGAQITQGANGGTPAAAGVAGLALTGSSAHLLILLALLSLGVGSGLLLSNRRRS